MKPHVRRGEEAKANPDEMDYRVRGLSQSSEFSIAKKSKIQASVFGVFGDSSV